MGGEGPTLSQAEKQRMREEVLRQKKEAAEKLRLEKAALRQEEGLAVRSTFESAPKSKKEAKAAAKQKKLELEKARTQALTGSSAVAASYKPIDTSGELQPEHASQAEEAALEKGSSKVVLNHSTHCACLKPAMVRLEKLACIAKIIPGALHQIDAHAEEFSLKVQRGGELTDNSVKLVARKGRTAQDVTIVFKHMLAPETEDLQQMIDDAVTSLREPELEPGGASLPGAGPLNKSGTEWREDERRKHQEKSHERHGKDVAARKAKKHEALMHEKKKKLQSSGAARDGVDIKAHAADWAATESNQRAAGSSWGGGRSKRIAQGTDR